MRQFLKPSLSSCCFHGRGYSFIIAALGKIKFKIYILKPRFGGDLSYSDVITPYTLLKK